MLLSARVSDAETEGEVVCGRIGQILKQVQVSIKTGLGDRSRRSLARCGLAETDDNGSGPLSSRVI